MSKLIADEGQCPASDGPSGDGLGRGLASQGLDLAPLTSRAGFSHAVGTVREIDQFLAAFPESDIRQSNTPLFSWEQLERQLKFLAGTPHRKKMVADRVATLRKFAAHKPEEMVLQEILIEAWVLLDEEPQGVSEAD